MACAGLCLPQNLNPTTTPMKHTIAALAAWSSVLSLHGYTDYSGTMDDFMGINIHTNLWKDYYHPYASYNHLDLSQAFKWVRNYQRWDKFEPANDDYQWMDTGGGQEHYFDEYYRLLNEDGINILVVPVDVPEWLAGSPELPVDNGDGTEPDHYRERAEYLAQMAARYGPTGGHSGTRLETPDQEQGLDYIRYFEDHNEPNQDWKPDIWFGELFGQYQNAAHDGRGVVRSGTMPLAGIKQGDPNAFHVSAGLVTNGVDDSYLFKAFYSAGRQAYDILNIHSYFRNAHLFPPNTWPWPKEAVGVSPEYYLFESGLDEIQKTIAWRDENMPGTPVWLTEFGWDTYDNGSGVDGNHSRNYAPELAQANYLMRSFPLLKKVGIDKAFIFFDIDPNSTSTQMFASSGVFYDKDTGYEAKTAYYFLSAMSQALGEYAYDGAHIFGEGDPEVYAFIFSKSATDKVVMLWCRERDELFDNSSGLTNYVFNAPNMTACDIIVPTDNVIGGVESALTISQPGQSGASVTVPTVSETPVFLQISGSQSIDLNLAPEVRAGEDFEVQLPTTTAQLSCEASDADGSVTGYQWTQLSGPTATISQGTTASPSLSNLTAGDYAFAVEATDNDGAVVRDVVRFSVTNRQPFPSGRHDIPGTIEAEDFDAGGEGISYHDTTTGNSKGYHRTSDDVDIKFIGSDPSNFYITDAAASEWVEYSVTVDESGLYTLDMNMAAFNTGRRVEVLMDGLNISGIMQVIQTFDGEAFTSNIAEPILLTEGDHVLRVHFETSGTSLDSISLQPYDDGVPPGEYFHLVNTQSGWTSLRIFYEVKWQDDIDVLAGGNDTLSFYLSDESAGLTADWANLKIALADTSSNSAEIVIGNYETNIGINWTQVEVPLSVFSTAGVDLNHVEFMEMRSGNAGAFDIGIDEITFSGGTTPFLWYGDDHDGNPLSNSPISLVIESTGGVGYVEPYNEPPFVDAGPDAVIRPAIDTFVFDGSAYDIDGAVTAYAWTQLSGPTPALLSGQVTEDLTLEVSPAAYGTYVFRLTATDNSGNTCTDDVELVYEPVGGYINVDHTASNWKAFTIFYDEDKEPQDVVSGASANTQLEIHFKRFDTNYAIDWTKLFIEAKDDDSPATTGSVTVAAYASVSIDGDWVKVVFPLTAFSGVNFANLNQLNVRSGSAGPFYDLGIDEIRFVGGSDPFLWYGDDHAEVVFNSNMPADLVVNLEAADGVPME